MADLVTVAGGARHGVSSLSPAEHQAAIHALSKLSDSSGASTGVASVLGGAFRSATLSGGATKSTFAGGVHDSTAPTFSTLGSDTVVAGSAFTKLDPTQAGSGASHALSLSGDTINVAGATAASLKNETVHESKAAGQTITLSDKTTITLTGVSHDVTKPH
jgi:hypothetical protein